MVPDFQNALMDEIISVFGDLSLAYDVDFIVQKTGPDTLLRKVLLDHIFSRISLDRIVEAVKTGGGSKETARAVYMRAVEGGYPLWDKDQCRYHVHSGADKGYSCHNVHGLLTSPGLRHRVVLSGS